jgi:hypothetical protein
VTVVSCHSQSCHAVWSCGVYNAARIQQQLHRLGVAAFSCVVQRCPAVGICGVDGEQCLGRLASGGDGREGGGGGLHERARVIAEARAAGRAAARSQGTAAGAGRADDWAAPSEAARTAWAARAQGSTAAMVLQAVGRDAEKCERAEKASWVVERVTEQSICCDPDGGGQTARCPRHTFVFL